MKEVKIARVYMYAITSVPLTAVGLWARGMLSLSGFSKLDVIYVTRKGLEEVVGSIPTSPPYFLRFQPHI